jgi:hypothetical protein
MKSSSQVNFLAYYGSINQSTFTKFWNLKTFFIHFDTVRLKWKTGFIAVVCFVLQPFTISSKDK